MINKVGREIPQEILDLTGKKPYMGYLEFDNYEYVKSAPKTRAVIDPTRTSWLLPLMRHSTSAKLKMA